VSAGVRLHPVHQVIRVNSSAGFCMEGRNRPLGIRNATLLPKAPLWKECIKRTELPSHIHDEVYTKRFLKLFIDLNIRRNELHALL
jgi:hypothetical protein